MAAKTEITDVGKADFQSGAVTTSLLPESEQDEATAHHGAPSCRRSAWKLHAKAWTLLLSHGAGAVSLALGLALALNGYRALDDEAATRSKIIDGRLVLRVADVTTLISAALVVVRLLVSSWTTRMVWACAHNLYAVRLGSGEEDEEEEAEEQDKEDRQRTRAAPSAAADAQYMRQWKLPAWLALPPSASKAPRSGREWIVSAALAMGAVQGLLSPLLTGAVNWNSQLVPTGATRAVAVPAVDPRAAFSGWYWFRYSGYSDSGLGKRPHLRAAAGFASLAWGDQTTLAANGSSLTGNGCRHVVVGDSRVGTNSTLLDAVVPCIQIHDIAWYAATDDVPTAASDLTMVDDDPTYYYEAGAAQVYDAGRPWTDDLNGTAKPAATLHNTAPLTVRMLIKRVAVAAQPNSSAPCARIDPTIFGADAVDRQTAAGRYVLAWGDATNQNCYWYGVVRLTAGVARSPASRYLSARIVEDQTPLDDVVFAADPWVQEALWMLPDLMTMVAVMNATLLPTWDNADGYLRALVTRSYLAAWDALHHAFDEDQRAQTYRAVPAASRQIAAVSLARVGAWLACCLLMTVSGSWLLAVVVRTDDLDRADGARRGQHAREAASDGQDDLTSWLSSCLSW